MMMVVIVLVLCVLIESMVIKELLEQRRQIALQLKLLRDVCVWRMDNNEEV